MNESENPNKSVSSKPKEREFITIRISGLETQQELFFRETQSKVPDRSPTLAFKRILNTAMAMKKWQASGETLTPVTIDDPGCGWFEMHPDYKRPVCWRYISKQRFPSAHVILNAIIESRTYCRDCVERDRRHDESEQLKKVKAQKPSKVIYIEHPTKTEEREVLAPMREAQKQMQRREEKHGKQVEIFRSNVDDILRHIPEGRFKVKLLTNLAKGNLDREYL